MSSTVRLIIVGIVAFVLGSVVGVVGTNMAANGKATLVASAAAPMYSMERLSPDITLAQRAYVVEANNSTSKVEKGNPSGVANTVTLEADFGKDGLSGDITVRVKSSDNKRAVIVAVYAWAPSDEPDLASLKGQAYYVDQLRDTAVLRDANHPAGVTYQVIVQDEEVNTP